MIDEAQRLVPETEVKRTVASQIDTLTGHLGEMAFAKFHFGNWKLHTIGANKGKEDFPDIEIKTSAFPFRENLNLLVREDYAQKRKPKFYVQIILDTKSSRASSIEAGTSAIICGFAVSDEVDSAPLRDFGSKFGSRGGYRCHYVPIIELHSIENLKV